MNLTKSEYKIPKIISAALFLILTLFLGSTAIYAQQETGQINGTVTDPNSSVVPNATVTVKNIDNGREVTVQTGSEGNYTVASLQPGLYDVTVTAQGFAVKTERVQVTVGSKIAVNTQVGVTEQVNTVDVVAGGVAEVNTTNQEVSNVVTSKQITELPTLTRNPYDLVALSGNISTGDPGGSTGRGVGASINGQRSASTGILLDGVENVDLFVAGIGQQTPLDSVGEFRVITSNFSAESGRASGGIVNAVTKSGTNSFNGTAYAFNRNSALAANSFDNNARGFRRGQFNRNQFGYAIGGPIVKDKLFFFNSTEWTRVRSQDTLTVLVPTPQLINASAAATRNYFSQFGKIAGGVNTVATLPCGNFLSAGNCNTLFPTGGTNFPLFNQVSFSIPADAGGGFPQNTYSTVTRIDYNLSDKTQIFGRYAIESPKPFAGNYDVSPYEGFTVGTTSFNQNALVSVTHSFSTNFISQTKLGYLRLTGSNTVGSDPNTPTLSGNFANSTGLPVYYPGFLSTAPGVGLPTSGTQNLGQVNQDFTYVLGNHNFRFGGQFIYIQDNELFPAYQNASQILGTSATQVLTNLVNGRLVQFSAAINPQGRFPGQTVSTPVTPPDFSRSNRYKEFALYVNDSWRIVPRLTLNLGLRYELYGPQKNKDSSLDSNFYFGSGNNIFEQIRNGRVDLADNHGGLWKTDKNNFAPRVGFAFDVTGDGKTSIRGGYGLSYERNFGNVTFNVIQNPPNYAVLNLLPSDTGGTLPIYTNSAGPLTGSGITRTLPRVSLRAVDPDIVNAYAHFYSAAFEREVYRGTVASVTYSGSAGRDLYSIANLNRTGTGLRYLNSNSTNCPGLTGNTTLNCNYTGINFRGNDGYSNYNGVTFALDSNDLFRSGLTMTNRYTFSKSRDNLSSTFSDGTPGGFGLGFIDPFNPSMDYGYADFDVRHRFVSSFIYDLPVGRNFDSGFLKRALGGFQLTGQVNIQSGTPFSVYDCSNAQTVCIRYTPSGSINFSKPERYISTGDANTFIFTDLRNQTLSGFTDVSGFTEVGPYPANMLPRNSFRGPGGWNVNLGLYKVVALTEKYRLQFRLETFNVFNRANYAVDGNSLDISSSDYVTVNKVGSRNVQLAVKFLF